MRCADTNRIGACSACVLRLSIAAFSILAGCSSVGGGSAPKDAPPPGPTDYGQVAVLRSIGGSAAWGKIRVINRGSDGAAMLVSLQSLPEGPIRIALHDTPNCTSPNGFSAGPVWAPASAGKPGGDLVPIQYSNPEKGWLEVEIRLSGVRAAGANGVAGHSVVVYASTRVTDAQPGVRNDRIACGVFEPATLISF